MDDVNMLEIEFDFWTKEMIAARAEYKDCGSKASEFKEAYIEKTKVIQVELEASRRFCEQCRLTKRDCDMQRPCSACVERDMGPACSNMLKKEFKPVKLDEERAPFMWELTSAEHSDLIDLAMPWQRHLANTIQLRMEFWQAWPNAFHRVEDRLGHLNAISIARQEHCKVTTRICDHFAWRDLPTGEFGEPSIRWNRSTMVDKSHYGTHTFGSTSQSPTKRLRDSQFFPGRRLRRTD